MVEYAYSVCERRWSMKDRKRDGDPRADFAGEFPSVEDHVRSTHLLFVLARN